MPLRVAIAGGTGLVGRALAGELLDRGDEVIVVGRSKQRIAEAFGDRVAAETYESLSAESLAGVDAVVNLAGENVGAAMRWSKDDMEQILSSRVEITSRLADLVSAASPNCRLLNASGISVYGAQDDDDSSIKDEDTSVPEASEDFLTDVSIKWEAAAASRLPAARLVLLRIGVVLCPGEGALGKMELPFKFGFGGRLGSGRQCLSWISLRDACRSLVFLLDNPTIAGPVNLVAGFVPQMTFAEALAGALRRPCILPAPAWALRLVLGSDMAKALVLSGHRVQPARLTGAGFAFEDSDVAATLRRLYSAAPETEKPGST